MTVSLIVAMSENGVIGRNNALPWHLPDDLKRFKRLTLNHAVIMGRKTFESIGKPLPQRRNMVVTRNQSWRAAGVDVAHNLDEAISMASAGEEIDGEVFIIGGAALFREAASGSIADRLLVTLVHAHIEGDVFFPQMNWNDWRLVSDEHHSADAHHAHAFSYRTYERAS